MSNLKLEIISPEGILFNGDCHMAVVPSALGDIGFMHNHEMVIASLREGEIVVFNEKNEALKSFAVKSGFAKMQEGGRLLVLVE
jgi:F-type H+-transporting ATPase subunit epsilon